MIRGYYCKKKVTKVVTIQMEREVKVLLLETLNRGLI